MYLRMVFKYLLAAFWVIAGTNHFLNTDFYLNIMPDYLPAHDFLVKLSGVTEIVAGLMVATPRLTKYGAWFCIAHLVVFFSVHIDMIVHASDRYAEIAPALLWLRIVLQFVLIYWAWLYTRDPKGAVTAHVEEPVDELAP